MNVSLENIDQVSALLTVKVEKADYQKQVDHSLKELRRKVQIPGFRNGMVPMSLIQKKYRKSIVAEEINKLLPNEIYGYIEKNSINMIGEPMANEEKQPEINFDTMEDFEFVFDIAIAPEFELKVTKKDKVDYYTVEVTDETVNKQIDVYTQRYGKYEKVESFQEKDMLKGFIVELDEEGNIKEGGILLENAVILPEYMVDDTQREIFNNAKIDDVLVFNPNKAYGGSEVEIASLLHVDKSVIGELFSDFSFQVREITRFVASKLDQEFFDKMCGEGLVKSEEEFRAKVKEAITSQFVTESDYKFLIDAREMLIKKLGKLEFPEALLKRYMNQNNSGEGSESVDERFEKSLEELKWALIKEKLIKEYEIKIEHLDMTAMAKEITKNKFMQYGVLPMADEILESYAEEILKKKENIENLTTRVVEMKLIRRLKETVKLNSQTVTQEEFDKLFS